MNRLVSIAVLALGLAPAAAQSRALTLADAEQRTLARHPDLAPLDAAIRAARGAADQAHAFPNPVLTFEAEDFGGDLEGFDQSQLTYSIEQRLELGGKRRARRTERGLEVDVARATLEVRRREIAAETRRRFTRCLGLQERVVALEAALATAQAIESSVVELVRAGEASGIDTLRARNETTLARAERDAALAELGTARRELAASWAGSPDEFDALAGTLAPAVALPPLDALTARLVSSPESARQSKEVARLDAALDLERRNRWPDLGVQFGFREQRALGIRTWVAAVAIPLPLFDRNAGAIHAADAQLERGRREQDGLALRLRTELDVAYGRVVAAANQVAMLRGELLPNVQRVLDGYTEGYRRGKFRLLDLLDARRMQLAAGLRVNEALVQLGLAHADLERLIGPLPQE